MAPGETPLCPGDKLEDCPFDGVTRLRFSSSSSNRLLVSSWDQSLRLYNASERQPCAVSCGTTPLLDACLDPADDSVAYTAGLDGTVQRWDLASPDDSTVVGSHLSGARCVEYLAARGLLVSGGWDQALKLWDTRAAGPCVRTVELPGKVYSMSAAANSLVVGTSGRHILVFDVRKIESGLAWQQRESSLKYQTRCVAACPDGRSFVVASVEGRVALEFLDERPEVQAHKYAFKCHRTLVKGGADVVFPVHALAFHPTHGTFATGGGDGVVSIWDGANKKRLAQVSGYPTSVSAVTFNHDGTLMAVAASYCHEHGERDAPPDEVYVRAVQQAEVRPKAHRTAA